MPRSTRSWSRDLFDESRGISLFVVYYLVGMVVYTGAAYFLTRGVIRRFDALADRPRRPPENEVVLVTRKPAPDEDLADVNTELP